MDNKPQTFEAMILLEAIKKLGDKISFLNKGHICTAPGRSESVKDLFGALAKAQADMPMAALSSENPYFKSKYAGLPEYIKATRPALSKNGLSVVQPIIENDEGQRVLLTILAHSSGQYIESRIKIVPPKADIQTFGSYVTYLRRYSYAAIIGAVASDDDDDGEVAVATQRDTYAKGVAINRKYNPREEVAELITKEQLEELEYELGEYDHITEMVLDGLKIQNLADMPKSKFLVSIKRIREIKESIENPKKKK